METGKQHLERNDYIVSKQKREMEEAKVREKELEKENEAKMQQSESLDKEITQKQQKANRENGNAILSGLANLAGKGKYAQLEAENIEMKKQVAQIPQVVAQKVEALTSQYKDESERTKETAHYWSVEFAKQEQTYKGLLTKSKKRELALKQQLEQHDETIATMKDNLAGFLKYMSEMCRSVVQTIITFSRDFDTQFFTFHQANIGNDFLVKEAKDREKGARVLNMFARLFLNIFEHEKGKQEVNNVANNFEWYQRMKFKREDVRVRSGFRR